MKINYSDLWMLMPGGELFGKERGSMITVINSDAFDKFFPGQGKNVAEEVDLCNDAFNKWRATHSTYYDSGVQEQRLLLVDDPDYLKGVEQHKKDFERRVKILKKKRNFNFQNFLAARPKV